MGSLLGIIIYLVSFHDDEKKIIYIVILKQKVIN